MIPGYLSAALERQQNQALKNIYGIGLSARKMREKAGIKTLYSRQEDATLKFAEKAVKSERFGVWFPRRAVMSARSGRPFVEKVSRTERNRNAPINYMIRLLNNSRERAANEASGRR